MADMEKKLPQEDDCTHDCSTCGSDCSSKSGIPETAPLNENSRVGKVYAVMGGKGGAGRTTAACLLASQLQKRGYQTAVLDADITGPGVPSAFGLSGRITPSSFGMFPMETENGTQVISVNLIIPNPTDPVIARGTLVDNTVKKFWSETIWEDVDIMFVDFPAGTGEVPLSVMRTLPLDGAILVTTPQELAAMITEKSAKMAKALKIPAVGLVENMAYYRCPDCGKEHGLFGDSRVKELAERYGIGLTARLPLDPSLTAAMDAGNVEAYDTNAFDEILNWIG